MRFEVILIGLLISSSFLICGEQINKVELKELEEFIVQNAASSLELREGTMLAHVKNDFNTDEIPFRIWKSEAGKLKAGTLNDFRRATGNEPNQWPQFLYLFALKFVNSGTANVEAWVIHNKGGYQETWELTKKDQQWTIIKKAIRVHY